MFEELLRDRANRSEPSAGITDGLWPVGEAVAVEFEPEEAPRPAEVALIALEDAQRRFQAVEAERVAALLVSYETAMADLAELWGTDATARDGLPGRAVVKQAAAILRCTERMASHLLDSAIELRDSFPKTWAVFQQGRATWRAVDTVVQQAIGLHEDARPAFDDIAAAAVERSTAGRLADRLRRARERLQDDTASARAEVTRGNRRVDFDPLPDGEVALTIRGPAVKLVAIDHALLKAAVAAHGHEGEERSVGALRFDIAVDLLLEGIKHAAHPECGGAPDGDDADSPSGAFEASVPQRRGVVPTVALTVPALAWLGHTSEQAILAGYGPIDLDTARELCADAPSFLRVLTDPVSGVRLTMDRKVYSPPPDLRRWLRIRDEQCSGLGCRRPAHLCDIDHVTEWHDGGTTDARNLKHLCRRCHLVKSSGLWRSRVGPGEALDWTSPWGRTYPGDPPERSDPAPAEFLQDRTDQDPTDDCPF